MGLKTYSLRLEEEEFEKLRKSLSEHGDPDVNVNYLVRAYIRDLNAVMPGLKKSELGLRNVFSFWSSVFRQMGRTVDVGDILKGRFSVEKLIEGTSKESTRKFLKKKL